jgi:hypothetical protein
MLAQKARKWAKKNHLFQSFGRFKSQQQSDLIFIGHELKAQGSMLEFFRYVNELISHEFIMR